MCNVNRNVPKHICTGCCTCQSTCPVDAISMKADREGFLYPIVDNEKCIKCEICSKKCPVLNPQYTNTDKPRCIATFANDDIRLKSASGGIYAAFAEKILEQDGYICGAVYKSDWSVEHIVGNTLDVLEKTRNSKYVQSNAGLVYRDVEKLLENGKKVLFSGTPCQVAGLYAFLDYKKYNNLFTMDLICHGVPSHKVLRKYLNENYGNKSIKNIDFRAKDYYGWSTEMTVEFDDGDIYRNTHDKDTFYQSFLPCLALRKSCETCIFSKLPRQGDISIGDFWGIDRYKPELNDKKGTSVVLVNNKKGAKIVNIISDMLNTIEDVPIEYALKVNKTIAAPFKAHFGRKHFFLSLDILPMEKLIDHAMNNHYDVGIAGLWYGFNYGSILTYYALYETIKQFGLDPFLLAKPYKLWTERYADVNSIAGKFIYPRCNVMNYRQHDNDWLMMNNHCDAFLVGSDVVWNYEVCGRESGAFFFLDFVQDNKKKIAYASSFGQSYNTPFNEHEKNKYYMQKFDAVSVREMQAVEICRDKFHVKADMVLDPVFLCDRQKYDAIADSISLSPSRKIMAYILGPNIKKRNLLLNISADKKTPICMYANPNNMEVCKEIMQLPITNDTSVEYWLYDLKNCDLYIGDSFHGLCFSLIFKKNFICVVERNVAGLVRFTNLLSICGLEDRLVFSDEPYQKIKEILNRDINYEEVDKRLEKYIEFSKKWLENALKEPKSFTYGLEDRVFELEKKLNELYSRHNF